MGQKEQTTAVGAALAGALEAGGNVVDANRLLQERQTGTRTPVHITIQLSMIWLLVSYLTNVLERGFRRPFDDLGLVITPSSRNVVIQEDGKTITIVMEEVGRVIYLLDLPRDESFYFEGSGMTVVKQGDEITFWAGNVLQPAPSRPVEVVAEVEMELSSLEPVEAAPEIDPVTSVAPPAPVEAKTEPAPPPIKPEPTPTPTPEPPAPPVEPEEPAKEPEPTKKAHRGPSPEEIAKRQRQFELTQVAVDELLPKLENVVRADARSVKIVRQGRRVDFRKTLPQFQGVCSITGKKVGGNGIPAFVGDKAWYVGRHLLSDELDKDSKRNAVIGAANKISDKIKAETEAAARKARQAAEAEARRERQERERMEREAAEAAEREAQEAAEAEWNEFLAVWEGKIRTALSGRVPSGGRKVGGSFMKSALCSAKSCMSTHTRVIRVGDVQFATCDEHDVRLEVDQLVLQVRCEDILAGKVERRGLGHIVRSPVKSNVTVDLSKVDQTDTYGKRTHHFLVVEPINEHVDARRAGAWYVGLSKAEAEMIGGYLNGPSHRHYYSVVVERNLKRHLLETFTRRVQQPCGTRRKGKTQREREKKRLKAQQEAEAAAKKAAEKQGGGEKLSKDKKKELAAQAGC